MHYASDHAVVAENPSDSAAWIDARERRLANVPERHSVLQRYDRRGARHSLELRQQTWPLMRLEGEQQYVKGAETPQVVGGLDACRELAQVAANSQAVAPNRVEMRATGEHRDGESRIGERRRQKTSDGARSDDRYARHAGRTSGDGQIRTAEWGFCRALPYHLATSPFLFTRLPGAGSGNRTHASTLGRSQATITSYLRRGTRFESVHTASYNTRFKRSVRHVC